MATATDPKPAVVKAPAVRSPKKAEVVEYKPEESVWQEYSAHNEFPLSFGASLIIHVFIILFAALVVREFIPFLSDDRESPTNDNVVLIGGGGGEGQGGGDPLAPKDKKEVAVRDKYKDPVNGITIRPEDYAKLSPTERDRMIENAKTEADKAYGLADKVRREGEIGQGGSGSGGGKGTGKGTGSGPGVGAGNSREELLRWVLRIPYSSPSDYQQKLHSLGVILSIELGEGKYQVFEDLGPERPASKIMNEKELMTAVDGRIVLESKEERAIRGLSEKIGYPMVKQVTFYLLTTDSFYEELTRKEQAFKGKTMQQIKAEKLLTEFYLSRVGGRWDVKVVRQYRDPDA